MKPYDGERPILAIESSCDETAVAILRPPGIILSSLIASQAEEHARFGGVVPEVASRNHLLAADPLVRRALSDAGLTSSVPPMPRVSRSPLVFPTLPLIIWRAISSHHFSDRK